MGNATGGADSIGWDDVAKKFVGLVVTSPAAVVARFANFVFGYLLSLVIFNYRIPTAIGRIGYLAIGTCYTCLVFLTVNIDIILNKRAGLGYDDISTRIPITLLFDGVIAFVVIIPIILYRERSNQTVQRTRSERASEARRAKRAAAASKGGSTDEQGGEDGGQS